MNLPFARRVADLRASEIREILKVTARPEIISFAGGLPAPELFPVAEMEAAAREVLTTRGAQALQYSTTEGDPALRARIAARLTARGTPAAAGDVLITTGSQQGIDLTGRLFLDEGDAVLCESPTYLGAITAFRAFRPRFVEIATDDDGMLPSDLERALAAEPRAKLVYVVPDFQNPTGRTWSLARRRAFMDVVARHDVAVLEDNPYGEVRFEGEALPSLKSMDARGQVVQLGTFSKIFCPGLRIGWLVAAPGVLDKYVLAKQGADLHTATLGQAEAATYLERFDLDANLARIRALYRERRDAMIAALESALPAGTRFTRPSGGLFLWVELPEGVDARRLLVRSLERHVAFVPGGPFFPNGGHENTLRLNFSNMPPERIAEGIARLGEVLAEELATAIVGAR